MSYQISQNLSLNIYNRWLLAKNSNIFTSIKWEKFRLGSTKLIFHFLFGLSYIGVINTNIVWSFGPVSNKFGCRLRRNLLVCGMKNNLPLASRHLLMMWYLNTVTFIGMLRIWVCITAQTRIIIVFTNIDLNELESKQLMNKYLDLKTLCLVLPHTRSHFRAV